MNVVYLHGIPGSARELEIAGLRRAGIDVSRIYAPNRSQDLPEADSLVEYIRHLEANIDNRFPGGGPLHLIGFSLGARIALELAASRTLRSRIQAMDLISPAAPLELGHFLPHMAGRPVFELARRSSLIFRCMVWLQGLLARFAPSFLYNSLFASAAGADAALASTPLFRSILGDVLLTSLSTAASRKAYRREVSAYVRPWAESVLPFVHAKHVTIWQGEADNWTPPAMASALASSLTSTPPRVVHLLTGLSHYSTLAEALPRILGASKEG